MSFIRPEAAQTLRRWAEPAIYGGLACWGLVHGITLILRGTWTGWVLAGLGIVAALGLAGAVQRTLVAWRNRQAGPGTVSIREGQIAYFGPLGGAILALDALTAIDIRTGEGGGLYWVLADEIGQIVEIPGGADGAVALLDRLGTLKGFDHSAVTRSMRMSGAARQMIWRRDAQRRVSAS